MNPEEIWTISDTALAHATVASNALADCEIPCLNIGLYHISEIYRMILRALCREHSIPYANCDPLPLLFEKTRTVLPKDILEIEQDICYWNDELRYEDKDIMTVEKAKEAGLRVQDCYNANTAAYLNKALRASEENEPNELVIF